MLPKSFSHLRELLARYDLGELSHFERNERGFVNLGFAVEVTRAGAKKKYFLRRYRGGIREEELLFEHTLIKHLVERGFPFVARVLKTRQGQTYLNWREGEGEAQGFYYALFDYLPGEDRYTWVDPRCSEQEIRAAAAVLAQYHAAVADLRPRGRRAERRIFDLLPEMGRKLSRLPAPAVDSAFETCLHEGRELLRRNLGRTAKVLRSPEGRRLPRLAIHCDYHPGNLKFQGEHVVGLFDFDWSKIDARCFDVALALWYFFTSWQGEADGVLRLADASLFYREYQAALQGAAGIGPMGSSERRFLPEMLAAANLYVLNWAIDDYYTKEVNAEEYLAYLKHGLHFIEWFERPASRRELQALFSCESE